jgi:O-methyltransferase
MNPTQDNLAGMVVLNPWGLNMQLETLLDGKKIIILIEELIKTKEIKGDIAEIGTYKGGTAFIMHHIIPSKQLHLYDTFNGIVKTDKFIDLYHNDGEFSNINVNGLKKYFPKAIFRIGTFPDTFTEQKTKFSFIHSDTDTYFGTKATLNIFSKRMSSGGIILIDDWGDSWCPGVVLAINEYLKGNKDNYITREYEHQFVIEYK